MPAPHTLAVWWLPTSQAPYGQRTCVPFHTLLPRRCAHSLYGLHGIDWLVCQGLQTVIKKIVLFNLFYVWCLRHEDFCTENQDLYIWQALKRHSDCSSAPLRKLKVNFFNLQKSSLFIFRFVSWSIYTLDDIYLIQFCIRNGQLCQKPLCRLLKTIKQ